MKLQPVFTFTLLLLIQRASPSTVVIVAPAISKSILNFNAEVARLLTTRGHNVTLVVQGAMADSLSFKAPDGVEAIIVKCDQQLLAEYRTGLSIAFTHAEYGYSSIMSQYRLFVSMTKATIQSGTVRRLKRRRFDIGIGSIFSPGHAGLLEAMGVKSKVLLSPGNHQDRTYWHYGVPVPWSYVPSVWKSRYPEAMTLGQRIANVLMFASDALLDSHYNGLEQELFWKEFGDGFRDLSAIVHDSDHVFVNANEYLDIPRPKTHGVVYVDGIGMQHSTADLTKGWKTTMSRGQNGTVLFSLGSVFDAHAMPTAAKEAILQAFQRMPDYHFVVKWKGDVPSHLQASNMEFVKWFPQKALLQNPNVRAFFTHGGGNSAVEGARSGVPMVVMGLLYDQPGNGVRVERAGVGIALDKLRISEESIYASLSAVLGKSGYAIRAEKLKNMMKDSTVSPEDLLVKWVEYGESHDLPKLRTRRHLNFVQYHSLDVLAALSSLVLLVPAVSFLATRTS